jgi:flagella basal body P-ring formation protein FlgA
MSRSRSGNACRIFGFRYIIKPPGGKGKIVMPRRYRHRIAVACALLWPTAWAGGAAAAELQDPGAIRAAIERAAAPRLGSINDATVEIAVGAIDPRLQLAACSELEATLPAANASAMTAKVSCAAPRWTIYVPVRLHAWVEAVVAAANLVANRPLAPSDLTRGRVDLFAVTGSVVTDPREAEGKILRTGVALGTPLLSSYLDRPIAVRRGQKVILTVSDAAMTVRAPAIALEDGRVGDGVAVQNADSQKTLHAIVGRDGGVEIHF